VTRRTRFLSSIIVCDEILLAVERVAYVQLLRAVTYIVLSSRDETSYRKASPALEGVLKTLFYLEPKANSKSD